MQDVGRTREEFVNHEPQASGLRILREVYQPLYNNQINARALIVYQLWVIVPVNPRKNRASSELSYKSNRPPVSMGYRMINHLECW